MKQLNLLIALTLVGFGAFAQTDTTANVKPDTMRIGNIVIIKKGKKIISDSTTREAGRLEFERKQKSRISTNWFIVDLGFSNYDDQTNYAALSASGDRYLAPGSSLGKNDFKLRAGKSINVNIWFFMQRLNLIKKNVNLKYGLGLELNNYRYRSAISYKEDGVIPNSGGIQSNAPFIFRDSVKFSKNKLAADYLTVPVMLNFSTTPRYGKPTFSASFGVSAGYLYSQRNKQKSEERGKDKNKGDYDLERFKFSYIAEIGLGPVKFYGSYSPKSIYEHSLDMRPYNFGIRLSNW
ncbi:MAG: outer membrane beta-barrel protein [Bacteroidetes bacterium]|nr:outer membrane beta-barrel protein [Bacteroidota bacterium]